MTSVDLVTIVGMTVERVYTKRLAVLVLSAYLPLMLISFDFFFFSSRRRHTRCLSDWSSDVCSSDLAIHPLVPEELIGFLRGKERVFVVEEGMPNYIERELKALAHEARLPVEIQGKRSEERRVGKECRYRWSQ